jgi:pimeloyl-ACP methyl ester carboxylesterase
VQYRRAGGRLDPFFQQSDSSMKKKVRLRKGRRPAPLRQKTGGRPKRTSTKTLKKGVSPSASSIAPTSHYLNCFDREIHYVEWGDPRAPAVLLWHGLARNARDFDELAMALAPTYRVICPDMIGRGLSQWSPLPDAEYCFDFYSRVALALADQLGIKQMRWVGTSMGGALGIRAGATTLKGRITHLVLNDIGATGSAPEGAARIVTYVSNPLTFATVTEFEAQLREVYKPFGWMSDTQLRRMTETSVRRLPSGRITPHYDPHIVRQFAAHPSDYVQWESYDRLDMPTLLLRGANSDLLTRDVAQQMTRRGPRAELVEIAGCGHAPALNTPDQIDLIRRFLAR